VVSVSVGVGGVGVGSSSSYVDTVITTVVPSGSSLNAWGLCSSTVPRSARVSESWVTLTSNPAFCSTRVARSSVIPTTLGTCSGPSE